METLTIGQLAERGGVNLETIRYYEREGLIPPPPRKSSGHRAYGVSAVRHLRFIKRAQELGFSLAEIRELLQLKVEPNQLCTDVVTQIEAKTREVEKKIRHLEAIRQTLHRMKDSCDGHCAVSDCVTATVRVSDCPILESLDTESPS
jgi:MerR family transcriptional regulator, copper efflux regulator